MKTKKKSKMREVKNSNKLNAVEYKIKKIAYELVIDR